MSKLSRVPMLFRFLAVNCIVGIAASWLFLAGIIWLDVGGLQGLLVKSPDGAVALGLLAGGFAVTFGSAAMATAVWLMPYGEDGNGGRAFMSGGAGTAPAKPTMRVPVRSTLPPR